nr:Myc-type, basic helix-loop-helix (bHLH) domain-containing protein [Tanacetum cinerariifolium]
MDQNRLNEADLVMVPVVSTTDFCSCFRVSHGPLRFFQKEQKKVMRAPRQRTGYEPYLKLKSDSEMKSVKALKQDASKEERSLSAQTLAERASRRKISEKTQELGKLNPDGQKMNTAEMFPAAFKYVRISKQQIYNEFLRRIVVVACIYYIWSERNERLFSNEKRSTEGVIADITYNVTLKLTSLIVKDTKQVREVVVSDV